MSAIGHVEPQLAPGVEAVTDEAGNVTIRPMITSSRAIDLFTGDLARRGYSARTIDTYQRLLFKFADRFPNEYDVAKITADDCRGWLDSWNRHAPGTRAHAYSVLSSYMGWLHATGKLNRNPMERIARPRRTRPEDLDVVTVSSDGVRRLLEASQTWTEKLAIAIPAYLGPRRRAVAVLRLRDYDVDERRIRFREKGGKVIWKPVPDELANLIAAAIADGVITGPDDYLVPPEGPLNRTGDRDDRVVWRVVKKVADRAGVPCTVHALRAAFAVFYLERNPGDTMGLKELLGHRSFTTTEIYLRKLDRNVVMEKVRDLSWAVDEPPLAGTDAETEVYFIAAGDIAEDGTPVKVGYASDPYKRLEDLQTAHHAELALVHSFPGGEALERQLHADLAEDRIRGEWFRSSPRLRALLAGLQSGMAAWKAANSLTAASAVMGAGGFEPPFAEESDPRKAGIQQSENDLVAELLERARELEEQLV